MAKNDDFEEIEEQPNLESIDESEPEEDLSVMIIEEIEIQDVADCLIEDEDEDDFDILFKNESNNHKIDGKHALKRDTIFKGKLDEIEEDDKDYHTSYIDTIENSHYQIQSGSIFEQETRYHQDYLTQKNLSRDVYDVLTGSTQLDFSMSRRKPNRQTFNGYYKLLLISLSDKYSNSEIFVELSYYFSDNIFNIFKLLDKKYATGIIKELKNKGYLEDIGNINFV